MENSNAKIARHGSLCSLDNLFSRLSNVSWDPLFFARWLEQRWLELLLSTSQDASFEGMEALEENRRTLSSRGIIKEPEETEAEAKAEARGDERGDKHLLLSENGAKIPPRRDVNVSEYNRLSLPNVLTGNVYSG